MFAIFDFDWTLVKPKDGRTFNASPEDWQWWRPCVPEVLRRLDAEGWALVIVSDQSKPWKVDLIRRVVGGLGLQRAPTFAIGTTPERKKPNPAGFLETMGDRWDEAARAASFYCGDAAGRTGDWSDCDAAFAGNIGVDFRLPEDVFPAAALAPDEEAPHCLDEEVVVLVGYPGAGKSSWAARCLPAFARLSGDKLGTPARMLRIASELALSGVRRVAFDATNATRKHRAVYAAWARDRGLPVRCVWVDADITDAMDRAKQRAHEGGSSIANVVFYTFRKRFEPPDAAAEGFHRIDIVRP